MKIGSKNNRLIGKCMDGLVFCTIGIINRDYSIDVVILPVPDQWDMEYGTVSNLFEWPINR